MSEDMKIPEFWDADVFITMSLEGYDAGRLQAWGQDMSSSDQMMVVGKARVKISLDQSGDPREALIDSLTEQKAKVLAEAHIKAEALQYKIDDLLQIEYTSED